MQKKIGCKKIFKTYNVYSRKYLRSNQINYIHLNALRKAFLDCDESGDRRGIISKRDFLLKIGEDGFKFPLEFLIYFIHDIQVDVTDKSEEAKVSYENVKTIIDIFSNSPFFEK